MSRSMVSVAAAETPLILTVDIGSSSVRVLLYDRLGRQVAGIGAQERYEILATLNGAAEMDPDRLLAQVACAIDGALAQAGAAAGQIGGVAIDSFVTSLLAVDGSGRPLTPVITYADTRAGDDAAQLRRELDENAVQQRTGCLLRAGYWPARLAWLRRTAPHLWGPAIRWITFGEYLELQFFGRCRAGYSAASWSGMLDREQLRWDQPLLHHLGLSESQLSPLVDIDEPLFRPVAVYANRWRPLANAPWFPALGDGAAANLGSGCTHPGRLALTLGTTGALRMMAPAVEYVPPGLWCYRVDRRHHLLGGATSEGGNVHAWAVGALRLAGPAEVETALAAMPPDGHGLTILPFFAGERSPDWGSHRAATIHGLTLATTPLAILRAGLEAVALRFALIAHRVAGQSAAGCQLIASGSALVQSPVWAQIFADVLGRPVILSAEPEATSRGSALLALRSLGLIQSVTELPAADGRRFEPDPACHGVYREAVTRQQTLYASFQNCEL
jgi:gluconokinase